MRRFRKLLVAVLGLVAVCTEANAQQRLPLIQNIGIIPIQWEGDRVSSGSFDQTANLMNSQFYTIVKRAARFRTLNDELVKTSWVNAEGRRDLVENYELHGFISLNAAVSGETVRLVARLLTPDLQTMLVQTEAQPLLKLLNASKEDHGDLLRNLVFGLFNRLPIDIVVTSVQGRYVSLSGGSMQNVRSGDEIDIKRASVNTLHPADGSWLSFNTTVQGRIKVIDTKEQTSVALITQQSYEGAISVGDGLKVSDIPGRKFFIKDDAVPAFRDTGAGVVMVAPDKAVKKAEAIEQKPASPRIARHDPVPVSKPDQAQAPTANEVIQENEALPSAETVLPRRPAKMDHTGLDVIAGIESWKVSGGSKAKSNGSLLIFNYLAARTRMPFMPEWDLETLGALHFGSTKDGDYYGLTGSGKLIHDIDLGLDDMMVRVGGEGIIETIAVNNETYGGGDYIILGGFGGLEGTLVAFDRNVQWLADLSVYPFALGRAGVAGSKKSLGSFLGYTLRGEALMNDARQTMNWGGGLEFSGFDAKAGKKLSYSETSIYGLLRLRF